MASFYIYTHIRRDNGKPFYVGKGAGSRAFRSSGRNQRWKRIAEKHGHDVRIIADGLDEELAFLGEVELIDKLRRLGADLANMTPGGEGATLAPDDESRRVEAIRQAHQRPEVAASVADRNRKTARDAAMVARRSASIRAAYLDETVKEQAAARLRTEQARASHRAAMARPEVQARRVAARSRPVICVETGLQFEMVIAAAAWLRSNGRPSAQAGHISQACSGRRARAYGFTWRFAEKN